MAGICFHLLAEAVRVPGILSSFRGKSRSVTRKQPGGSFPMRGRALCAKHLCGAVPQELMQLRQRGTDLPELRDGPIKARMVSKKTTGGNFQEQPLIPDGSLPRPRPLLLSVAFSHPAAACRAKKKITSAKLFAEVISWS